MSNQPTDLWHCHNCVTDWSKRLDKCPSCGAERVCIQHPQTDLAAQKAEMIRQRQRIAPLPLEDARRLHRELLDAQRAELRMQLVIAEARIAELEALLREARYPIALHPGLLARIDKALAEAKVG